MLEGDIIISINRQSINSIDDVRAVQAKLKPGDAVAFHVIRKRPGAKPPVQSIFLSGTLPEN
jgi:S1-C subfamily serine protease